MIKMVPVLSSMHTVLAVYTFSITSRAKCDSRRPSPPIPRLLPIPPLPPIPPRRSFSSAQQAFLRLLYVTPNTAIFPIPPYFASPESGGIRGWGVRLYQSFQFQFLTEPLGTFKVSVGTFILYFESLKFEQRSGTLNVNQMLNNPKQIYYFLQKLYTVIFKNYNHPFQSHQHLFSDSGFLC